MNTAYNASFYARELERFKAKIGVFLVLLKENSLLCLRRHQTGIEDGFYVVPMGGVEEGETPLDAITREAFEEVNIRIKKKDLRLQHVMYRKHIQPDGYSFYQQDLFFVTHRFTGILRNLEPHKADDVRFFTLTDLPKTLSPFIGQAVECILSGIAYSEFGFSEK